MLRQLHALVVDHEPHCRDLLCRQLERTCPSITVLQTASSVLDTGAVVPMAVRKREALKQRLSLLMSA